jgi:hypothetical protein
MSRCADYFWNFQNGRCCHGNGQNAKKLKNTKMIIAGYSPNRTCKEQYPHLVERDNPKKSESVGQTFPQLPWKQKRGIKHFFEFLSSNFIKLCRNIHRSVWQLLGVEKKSKWRPLPW